MTTDPDRETPESAARLAAAIERTRSLEAELAAARTSLRIAQENVAAKELELREIYRSRAWAALTTLRSIKYRLIDPLLALAGINWPPARERPWTGNLERREAWARETKERPTGDAFDIVCLSICEWDDRFQRPQQLMARFGSAGHRVFWISRHFRRAGPEWDALRKRDNVHEVTLRGKIVDSYRDRLDEGARDILVEDIAELARASAIGPAAIVVQMPFWWPVARSLRDRLGWPVVYDCMDAHADFSTMRRSTAAQEADMLAGADVVTVSSLELERRALAHRPAAVMIRNGCDFDHFASARRGANQRPVVGYFGAISDWFDTALVAELAARRPDWDFVLVGSTYGANIARLAALPNVSLPGEEAYASLPDRIARFDVGIIPFKRTKLTEAVNPVKVYEMLASGLPVVSVPIPEVSMLAPLVRLASSASEFEREIAAALHDDDQAREARRAFARANDWDRRFESFRTAIAAVLGKG
jgi:glycosyltransferase involved in cell wall biosynthesis